ncbi:glycosyltransferase family 2 protein [Olleya namhaensis]|uniref:glycosyltransferase family 2 protein n=1 Tax=Olleya namhaensis TaxID=1144750 RepID=UPI00248F5817|nr:glycosyltransferase family 2 protein [Olleya namhaensis]
MNFEVSVVIPVYNAELFIKNAIVSAVMQLEVREVIIINDGSTDGSVSIIEELQRSDSRIKLFHHKNNQNKGRSASRNLGIQKATSNYIAFLDADDYYLENRFINDKAGFKENNIIEGIYNAVGFHFYRAKTKKEEQTLTLNTVNQIIKPEYLFEALLCGKYGHFHLNGLTVKRVVFKTIGLFNTSLKVAEDTDMFWKLALKCHLKTGNISTPVAIRGVHADNVFNNEAMYIKYTIKMYESVLVWAVNNKVAYKNIDLLLKWIWILRAKAQYSIIKDTGYWAYLFYKTPTLFFTNLWIKYFPVVRYRQSIFPAIFK